MKLTTRSRYGTLIVLDIAQFSDNGPVRIADIAKRKKISLKYTEKITGELRRAGILTSRRGPRGGHLLSKAAHQIAVGDVVRVLDWEHPEEECMGKASECDRSEFCVTRKLWQDAAQALLDTLNRVTFEDLVRDQNLCPIGESLFHPQAR